jgi:hypothetical protein
VSNEEQMRELASSLYEISRREKELKVEKERLRQQLFEAMAKDYERNPHLLPTRSIDIPNSFWDRTTLNEDEFFASRFPGWIVDDVTEVDDTKTYQLRRTPSHMPYSVEIEHGGEDIRVAKEINEYTPTMDWESLHDELPELFRQLAKPVEVFEINEDELERLVQIEPDVLSRLQRHMIVREPVSKMTTRNLKRKE